MVDLSHHTHNAGVILMLYSMVHFLKAKGIESGFLIVRRIYAALDLLDYDFCHCVKILNVICR